MPGHQKGIISEMWLKDLLLRVKRVGQLTCGTEKHRYLFFQISWSSRQKRRGRLYKALSDRVRPKISLTSFTKSWLRPVQ